MNDEDQSVIRLLKEIGDSAEVAWPYRDSSSAESEPTSFATELVSLSYIKAAVRRGARFWCALAIIGLALGLGYKVKDPTPYQATTTVLLPQDAQSQGAILNDVAVAQSRAVAALAVQKLGLTESSESFIKKYAVTAPTSEVLVITATAHSAEGAVNEANAIAAEFLKFRASLQRTEENIALSSLIPQVTQAKQQIQSLTRQISNLSQQTASASQQAKLSSLQSQLGVADGGLANANAGIRTAEQQATLQIKDSKVLDAAAVVPASRKKPILVAAAIGLFAGLVLGIALVTVRAVVTDRLRQRDDVAYALGAPVALSVGAIRARRWLPRGVDIADPRNQDVSRVVAHLRRSVPRTSRGPAALAVVAVDDPKAAAICVSSLAASCARDGMQVVLVDLVTGCPAARLFGVSKPGVVTTTGERGSRLFISIPDPAELMPVGPLPGSATLDDSRLTRERANACAQADLLLILTTLDPALGAEHLATWTFDAVAMVTAGRSSWARIHAAAEMLRLAHIRLLSAVLSGADKRDDSIGVVRPVARGQTHTAPRHSATDSSAG